MERKINTVPLEKNIRKTTDEMEKNMRKTTDETEAGIVLTIWGAIFIAGACTGSILGAVVCIFDCLMLGVILAASSKLEHKDQHLRTSREMVRKEANRE